MNRYVAILLWVLGAPCAMAQDHALPTLFDVTGVASDDVLNIRAQPDASAPILESLPPDATAIEITAERDGWGRLNVGETVGWVSLRYLVDQPQVWQAGRLPDGFSCFGTEPFWALTVRDGHLTLQQPGEEGQSYPVQDVLDRGFAQDRLRAVLADGASVIATPQQCSDGMSDRLYALRASVILSASPPRLLDGCCSVQP
ncbi:SH3 domain-containing protein [Paracoccus sp. Z330]|uniref:SH3 domain-containing protein n=1 Tax=Paracoccus onchidii TaxID=3017813 RepID=A0ABT4ZHA4_9RHOB|nr:SH3 domain-containing protein [Paracoccus onchidii]MDB6178111.1 SH3 domain-containing protein [Paracoccus onchidii]